MQFLVVTLSVLAAQVASKTVTAKDGTNPETNTAFGYITNVGQPLANRIHKAEREYGTIRKDPKITTEDEINLGTDTTFDYITKVGQPLANRIHKAERQFGTISKVPKIKKHGERFAKIIDGTAARLGNIPYQAGLIGQFNGGQSTCGGSLISSKRVLTAAHCWWDGEIKIHMFTVVLGSENLFSGGIRMRTSKVALHSKFNPRTLQNDIAMVYLPRAVQFSDAIRPIALPSGRDLEDDFTGYPVLAAGYGLTRYGNTHKSLNYVELQVISNEQCGTVYRYVRPTEICTWSPDARNICNGDSGGPLVMNKDNKLTLVGITSYGAEDCNNGTPSGYTRVTSYIHWIHSHL